MFVISPELTSYIQQANITVEGDTISNADFVKVYEVTKPCDSLIGFIKMVNAKLHVPKPPAPKEKPKTKEFLEQMARLRQMQKEEEYQRLINPAPAYTSLYEEKLTEKELTPAQENKQLKSHITTIFNILISVASVMYAIWYWTNSLWGLPVGHRVLMSLFFGLLVLIAEVVVYMSYLDKIEQAKVTERRKKEVKKVVKQINLAK